jgi:hypothetical protein
MHVIAIKFAQVRVPNTKHLWFSKVHNMVKKSKKGHQEWMRMFIDVVFPP